MKKERVLILCTGNSARSQMAEGLLRSMGGDGFAVESAGTVASFVRPQAIAAMAEIGIDITGHRSKCLDEFLGTAFDHIITVCDNANQTCPAFHGKAQRTHWSLEDPAEVDGTEEEKLAAFRKIRDQLIIKIKEFIRSH
ncbi:MAG TPA: arsenate reductase ArsC [Pyrinomonadaceae bacterium]|nr:arsenate reductase ArsC [Pyrinomonadaceae bacterium]